MAYERPAGASQRDFAEAREFEALVGQNLPDFNIPALDANDKLDYWVPGFYLEVKAKRQKLSSRWQLVPDVPERDLFVLDELSLRRALVTDAKSAYFLLFDKPEGRYFLGSCLELACIDRVRRNRGGKGKLIFDVTQLRRLSSLDQINEAVQSDMVQLPWRVSSCVGLKEPEQVES